MGVVALPGDVADDEASDAHLEHTYRLDQRPTARPSDAVLDELVGLVNEARRVTLFCGRGVAGAHDEVLALAERLKAPVGHALRGKEWIQYDNPYDVGMSGLLGYGACYEAMHSCDLLVLLGTDFPYVQFMPTKPKIVQVDLRRERAREPVSAGPGGVGDVKETVRALYPASPKSRTAPSWSRCLVATASWSGGCGHMPRRCADAGPSIPSTSPPPLTSWPTTTPSSPSTPACAPGRRG